MLGRLVFGLGLAAVTPSKPARRAPVKSGSIGVLAIVIAVAVMVAGNVTHTWTLMWFIVIPLVLSLFIAIGNIQKHAERKSSVNKALARMPVQKPVTTVAEMRERAGQITRNRRVAALLMPQCPVCAVVTGQSCTQVPGITVYLLDKSRDVYAHSLRIQKAVATGAALKDEVAAQFGGNIPERLDHAL